MISIRQFRHATDLPVYSLQREYDKARRICAEEGGHLAVLNSLAEAKMVTEIFRNSERITGSEYPDFASIGFHSHFAPEVQFVTIHNETLEKAGYNQWMKGRTLSNGKRVWGSLHISGVFNNHGLPTPLGFICELPIWQHFLYLDQNIVSPRQKHVYRGPPVNFKVTAAGNYLDQSSDTPRDGIDSYNFTNLRSEYTSPKLATYTCMFEANSNVEIKITLNFDYHR
ncbi:hemolymph lipopolysaccharide-binding protein-like [Diprion similis]|uniref:hemolymph lipopolysaccharide-binding protein-like n=1 Tax=Diprion similis TaxID=362088 RepID=UPI001EF81D13|nr:hemolymph lipopolysaccharide-binding protein-like [Diprion similis]